MVSKINSDDKILSSFILNGQKVIDFLFLNVIMLSCIQNKRVTC